jgi:hypothetical protein
LLPATLTAGAVLEALSAILVRGLGLATVTVPVGVAIATIPPSQGLAVRPEWTAQERRRRVRAEAQDRRRAERREDVNGMATIAVLSDAAGKLVERPGMATAGAVLGREPAVNHGAQRTAKPAARQPYRP